MNNPQILLNKAENPMVLFILLAQIRKVTNNEKGREN
jgi:hypothetical protein